ncbi:hypothetical protein ACFWYW_46140 [Nonomuraea sp. NPDC059023]|uniref:hypothetical protein n=1 Tax=unclassified Nonomuraea TaxID=2593643 RepID=UPI0036AD752A
MRKIVFHTQTTLDNRIANAAGGFREPFPWGEERVFDGGAIVARYRVVSPL